MQLLINSLKLEQGYDCKFDIELSHRCHIYGESGLGWDIVNLRKVSRIQLPNDIYQLKYSQIGVTLRYSEVKKVIEVFEKTVPYIVNLT